MALTPRNTENAEQSYLEAVSASLRWNYTALLAHGMLGMTGFRLLQAPTFLPAYIFLLSGSEAVVGFALAAQHIGATIASIPGGNFISHRKRVMPVFLTVGALMRVQVLGIALVGYLLAGSSALIATCIFLLLFGLFSGMQSVTFQFALSKLIPVYVRGRLTGFRTLIGGVMSSGVAMLGGTYFIDHNTLGNGYATTFLLAFGLTALGLIALAAIREPELPAVRDQVSLSGHLREIPGMLRDHPGYLRFIIARGLAGLAVAAVPFYVLYAGETKSLSGTDLGILTVAFLLTQTVVNFVWGMLADRTGNRLVFIASVTIWGLSVVLLLLSPRTMIWLIITFSGLGIGMGGFQIGSTNLILEFGKRQDLPMLIGVANTANSLMFAVGPILGGLFILSASYEALFWAVVALKALSVAATIAFVKEPRDGPSVP